MLKFKIELLIFSVTVAAILLLFNATSSFLTIDKYLAQGMCAALSARLGNASFCIRVDEKRKNSKTKTNDKSRTICFFPEKEMTHKENA